MSERFSAIGKIIAAALAPWMSRKLYMTLIGCGIMWVLFWGGVKWLWPMVGYPQPVIDTYYRFWYETQLTIRYIVLSYLGLQTGQNVVALIKGAVPGDK